MQSWRENSIKWNHAQVHRSHRLPQMNLKHWNVRSNAWKFCYRWLFKWYSNHNALIWKANARQTPRMATRVSAKISPTLANSWQIWPRVKRVMMRLLPQDHLILESIIPPKTWNYLLSPFISFPMPIWALTKQPTQT